MASPLLNFALIGRKSSGKTCLLTTLALPKELNDYDLNCNLSRSKKRYEEYLNQNNVKEFFGDDSVAKYDEMLVHIDQLIDQVKNGMLPGATPLTSKTAHIYNVDTVKQVNFDMALFDYAGELVEAESKVSDSLLKFLGSMSGLMVIVELGKNTLEGRKQSALDISNLQQFFKAIETNTDGKTRFNIPISLLITKFDQHPDFNKTEFEKEGQKYVDKLFQNYIESEEGKNIKSLCSSIKASTTEGCFMAFPVCAFGYVNLNQNLNIELPLKSVNVIEPFVWAAETYGCKLLKDVDEAINKSGIVTGLFNSLIKDYSSLINTADNLIPNDSEQKNQLEVLGKKLSGLSKKLYAGLAVGLVFLVLGTEFLIDRSNIIKINSDKLTVDLVVKNQTWLRNYSNSLFLRHSLSKFLLLSSNEATKKIAELSEKMDETLWTDILNTSEPDLVVEKLNNYLRLSDTKHSDEAKDKIDETLWNDILNTTEPKAVFVKLEKYLNNTYAKHREEARNKIDDTLWNEVIQTTDLTLKKEKIKNYLKIADAKHTNEANNLIKDLDLNSKKIIWLSKVDDLELQISPYKTGNAKIDKKKLDSLNAALISVKSEYNSDYNEENRLKNLQSDYDKLVEKYNVELFETANSQITTKINSSDDDNDWLEALSLTVNLHNQSWITKEQWSKLSDSVLTQLYNNCASLVTDKIGEINKNTVGNGKLSQKVISISDEISIINKISSSNAYKQIKEIQGLWVNGEKEYFDNIIFKMKKAKFVHDYNEIAEFAIAYNNNLPELLANQKTVLNKINSLVSFIQSEDDIRNGIGDYYGKLLKYKDSINNISKPQKCYVWIASTEWARSQFTIADKWCVVNIGDDTLSKSITTDQKLTYWQKDGKYVYLPYNTNSILIEATIKDSSSGFREIKCFGSVSKSAKSLLDGGGAQISVKGKVEGVFFHDDYKGSVTIGSQWISQMTELSTLKWD